MDKTAEHYLSSNDIIAFPKMGMEFNIDSVAFTVFGFDIRWYGIIIAMGMLLAMMYCFRRMKEFGLDSDRAIDVVLVGLIGSILGARSYYILFDADTTFVDFFKIRDGGLAIYGGLIGALLIGTIVAKIRKVKLLPFFDIASMGFLIGQGIGRWGNFVNKEAFGAATELPWGMASASIQSTLGSSSGDVILAHPCFLYESLWCIVGLVLLHLYSKHRKFDGELFLMYTAWYGFGRFFIEGLRTDSLYLGRLRVSQLIAGVCVVAAITVILLVRGHYKRNEPAVLYCDTDESKELLAQAEERLLNEKERKTSKIKKEIEAEKIPEEIAADEIEDEKTAETIDEDVISEETVSVEKDEGIILEETVEKVEAEIVSEDTVIESAEKSEEDVEEGKNG